MLTSCILLLIVGAVMIVFGAIGAVASVAVPVLAVLAIIWSVRYLLKWYQENKGEGPK